MCFSDLLMGRYPKQERKKNNIIIDGAIKIVYFGLTLELQCLQ